MVKKEKGFSLVELIIAIALIGIIGVAFLSALAIGHKAISIADERTTAESLARSQMEDIKEQDYINYSVDDHEEYLKIKPPSDYTIKVKAVPIDAFSEGRDPFLFNPEKGAYENDVGLQLITVTIHHLDKEILTLEGYKVDRRP